MINRSKIKFHLFSITKKDFTVQTFCSGGPGGQHQNKVASGVRIIHNESRAVGESRSQRSQHQNRKLALQRLVGSSKFKLWLNRKAAEVIENKTLEQKIDEAIAPENLKIEIKNDSNQWVTIDQK